MFILSIYPFIPNYINMIIICTILIFFFSDIDDELEIDYRKIENEDPDRMTESEVYQGQGVRKLNTQNYEHEYLRGGISPSIVQASKRLQVGKYAGVTVVRIGSKYHDGLKVTGVPIEAKTNARSSDEDTLSECSVSSGDICLCHNCRNKENGEDPLAQEINGKLRNVKGDESTLMLVSKSLGMTSPIKRPSSNTQDNRKNYNKDRVKAQERKDNNSRMPLSRCSSAKCQVFSPPTVKIDSTNLPVMACRAITGPRMRYEVVSSLGRKDIEDDRDSASSGSDTDLNKQIEAVARAQDIIDHQPSAGERTPKQSEVQIFSWRPALKDILRSQSVSLRRRSIDCIYADSTSQAKCLKHGRQCPEIPRTVQDDSVGGYPSSQVWSRGRRLKISIDMRSLRLPPIMSYSTRSVENNNSAGCVACMAGVSNSC